MEIFAPTAIGDIAWEGPLVPPPITAHKLGGPAVPPPVVTVGRPEIWPAAKALEAETGRKWTPPLGGASFWLIRLACTLHQPPKGASVTEATQTLSLGPAGPAAPAGKGAVYAYSLFPDRITAEDRAEFTASLGPELKFASGAGVKVGELGATIHYRKVFPVIQGYGGGEPMAYWVFRPHTAHPLQGTQFVYAVVAATKGIAQARASIELKVIVESTLFGRFTYGTPEEARAHTRFAIP